jgi:hypothetical protein
VLKWINIVLKTSKIVSQKFPTLSRFIWSNFKIPLKIKNIYSNRASNSRPLSSLRSFVKSSALSTHHQPGLDFLIGSYQTFRFCLLWCQPIYFSSSLSLFPQQTCVGAKVRIVIFSAFYKKETVGVSGVWRTRHFCKFSAFLCVFYLAKFGGFHYSGPLSQIFFNFARVIFFNFARTVS